MRSVGLPEIVRFYLEKSFSFRVTEPDAAAALTDG